MRVIPGAAPVAAERFEVSWLDADGVEQRGPLAEVAGAVAFEATPAVRSFPSYKGQRNFPGLYWSATVGGHVGFESWLEREHAMLLDFDPQITGYASQPMWLFWPEATASGVRRWRSHAPDFFARRSDGTGVLLDCRPANRIKPRDRATFDITAEAAAAVGWDYEVVDAPDPVLLANVRWLAGYRHPRFAAEAAREARGPALRTMFSRPRPFLEGVRRVGDPIAVLPIAYHLLWRHQLECELATPMTMEMRVRCGQKAVAR
ncbi:TnsA-like heteromeric transposase endonuclease subunit [Amycolatopsis rubida]|uniref:TnsA-like heteromeric transposase endonuclease subunit n=1 Tax=Amycolatopsis rubida TaxID=112413 RepID=A0A1I5X5L2_9PSEU|nr:TnsA-like heteromeric transposase endonuclease subunit [Amycolatopsis rubida]SFQ27262.1 hypothetical protein SAMN05421854_11045 [Amycolatopsis rubida]